MSMGLGTLNFGLFIAPMSADLGITRTEFGLAGTLRQYAGALSGPVVGTLLDRHGARWLLAIAYILAGLCVVGLGWIDSGWQMIALFVLMGVVGVFGPGQLLTTVPVMKWFVLQRPRAVGFMTIGIPLGALVLLPLTQGLIEQLGWRNAWMVLGLLAIVTVAPASLLWMRRQPEDLGLRPDGAATIEGDPDGPAEEHSWTRAEAMRTLAFWQLVIVVSLIGMAISSIALHRIPEFAARGIPPYMIAIITAWDAVLAGAGAFVFGMYGHRMPSQRFGALGFALLAISSVLMIYTYSTPMLFLTMTVWGFGIGGMMYMQSIVWAEFFGREHVGAIRGAATPITLLAGGLGAPVAGLVHDWLGTYDPVWWVSAGLLAAGAVTIALTRAPQH